MELSVSMYFFFQLVAMLWKTYWKNVGLVLQRLSSHLQQGDVVLEPLAVEVRVDDDLVQPSLDVVVRLVLVISMVVAKS